MASHSFKTCFVIQRFDGATYDKRYRETFAPAIERGGAKPIRADEVLGTKPIVEKIEEGIARADCVFAEISEDNPNVFLELGISLAIGIPTVIVCDKSKRASLPFDISHRPVEFYATDAQSDYEIVSKQVENAIAAALLEQKRGLAPIADNREKDDIDETKRRCLITLVDQSMRSPTGASLWELQKEASTQGISERMVALALLGLLNENLVTQHEYEESGGVYNTYTLSEQGQRYILREYSSLMQDEKNRMSTQSNHIRSAGKGFLADLDGDIPF